MYARRFKVYAIHSNSELCSTPATRDPRVDFDLGQILRGVDFSSSPQELSLMFCAQEIRLVTVSMI